LLIDLLATVVRRGFYQAKHLRAKVCFPAANAAFGFGLHKDLHEIIAKFAPARAYRRRDLFYNDQDPQL
jgi:hypothetical protein